MPSPRWPATPVRAPALQSFPTQRLPLGTGESMKLAGASRRSAAPGSQSVGVAEYGDVPCPPLRSLNSGPIATPPSSHHPAVASVKNPPPTANTEHAGKRALFVATFADAPATGIPPRHPSMSYALRSVQLPSGIGSSPFHLRALNSAFQR
jgi:hypothetical protein